MGTQNKTPTVRARFATWISGDKTSGVIMIVAAVTALIWANSKWSDTYLQIAGAVIGPAQIHLDLPVSVWASDGLLAVFFFVVGVELIQEVTTGSLSRIREAAVPVCAAVGGMAVPAAIFVGVVASSGDGEALAGWAVPTATDIAFAVAVLAIFGRGLPGALRVFLLTLAVADDLLAIVVIAVFYTDTVSAGALLASAVAIAVFAAAARSKTAARWWVLVPVAVAAWVSMHSSGVHPTIAGVCLGLVVPARPLFGEASSRAARFGDAVRPLSAGAVLPVFAFFAAGVPLADGGGLGALLTRPVAVAIVAGLVVGKFVGILGTTAVLVRFTPLRIPGGLMLRDLLPVGFLAGIGFTVSLLIAELSFDGTALLPAAKIAVCAGTVISAVFAAVALRRAARNTPVLPREQQ